MTLIKEDELKQQALQDVARKMILAARTAPKGRGRDNLVLTLVQGPDIPPIARRLREMGEKEDLAGFVRDAGNIEQASLMILAGTKFASLGLKKCGLCGFPNCEEKEKNKDMPCAFNTGDLGIAIGSAVSVAADHRVDNRVMYTVGLAVKDLGLLGPDVKIIYAIPLSATSKNPFFDRK